jgi:hypothetical protein
MEQRLKKQILIGSIFSLLVLAIVFGVYFFYFRAAPTCADGKLNQGEEGIDCGGPCSACELASMKDIKIEWVKALLTTGQNYDLVAMVSNPNQNYGSRKVDYEFKLYDLAGKEIGSKSGQTFILPRQKKAIVELKINASALVSKATINLGNVSWEKIANYVDPKINVFDKQYQAFDGGPPYSQASCILKNSGYADYKNISLIFLLFDADGELLGVNYLSIDGLSAGQQRYLSVPWQFPVNGQAARVDVQAAVDLFE